MVILVCVFNFVIYLCSVDMVILWEIIIIVVNVIEILGFYCINMISGNLKF